MATSQPSRQPSSVKIKGKRPTKTKKVATPGARRRVTVSFPVANLPPSAPGATGARGTVNISVPKATADHLKLPTAAKQKNNIVSGTGSFRRGNTVVNYPVRRMSGGSASGTREAATIFLERAVNIEGFMRKTLKLPIVTGMQIPDIIDFFERGAGKAVKVTGVKLGGRVYPITN